MSFLMRHIPDVIDAGLGLLLLLSAAVWLYHRSVVQSRAWLKRAVVAGWAFGSLVVFGGLAFRSSRIARQFPTEFVRWVGILSLVLVLSLLIACAVFVVVKLIPRPSRSHSPARRSFLTAARGAVFATPIAAAGYAVFVERSNIAGREVELPVAGLPKELHGLRIAQLSDIHLSPFLSEQDLARSVDLANEFRPHLAVVTGDLITSSNDPLDACLRQLGRLRADAGILGCHGNHEIYAGAEAYATHHGRLAGIEFLRSESKEMKFGGHAINFAGVDYQRMKDPYLVGAGHLVRPGMPNILLSHNPDVFPVAADLGFQATLSGHTHGGQITVEILNRNLSVARFYTPYVYGLYRRGGSSIYVTRGIGTVGLPARLGARPEVALIRLCAI